MKPFLFSFFVASLIALYDIEVVSCYPNVIVTNNIPDDWIASGKVVYSFCATGNFENLKYKEYFTDWRGACLIREVSATVVKGNQSIHAASYWSSGTGYSNFEIVR